MLKRLGVALAAVLVFASLAHGAGTVPGFSLVPQFDLTGKVAPGCKLYVIQAGTVATPQTPYQDTALTLPQPNPMTCDAGGRLPQWFVADGSIKLRLTTSAGTAIYTGDNLLVIGPSSGGGGGGGTVDPTTISATGDLKVAYGTSVLSGWVRANGRTIGSATSGATERANADCQALFEYLWGADANLSVSGGRGASASADWAANKTIALPDLRGRVIAGLDSMGSSAAGRIGSGSGSFTTGNNTLGSTGGAEVHTLVTANLPPYTPSGTVSNSVSTVIRSTGISYSAGGTGAWMTVPDGFASNLGNQNLSGITVSSSFTGAAMGGTSSPLDTTQPTMLATYYVKL
jgi:microcystin-dependent protein